MPPTLRGMNLPHVLQHPLLRKPLVFLVAGEALLLISAAAVAWHVWQAHQATPAAVARLPAQLSPRQDRGQPTRGLPQPPARPSPASGTGPGFRVDADFLSRQMGDLNRDQAALENVEWRLARAAMQGMKLYLERIVVPLVERAEGRPR